MKTIKCPICNDELTVQGGIENWIPTPSDPDSGGDPYYVSCACGLHFCPNEYDYDKFIAKITGIPKVLTLSELKKMNNQLVYAFVQDTLNGDLILPSLVAYNADIDDMPNTVYLINNIGGRSTYDEFISRFIKALIYDRNPSINKGGS